MGHTFTTLGSTALGFIDCVISLLLFFYDLIVCCDRYRRLSASLRYRVASLLLQLSVELSGQRFVTLVFASGDQEYGMAVDCLLRLYGDREF